jgi:type I restriction enzyme S subunit
VKQWSNILEAVDITNNRVKPFKGERRYLATGDLIGDEVNGNIVSVDYETKPSRADLLVEDGNIIVARMQATNKVLRIDKATEDLIVSTGFLTLKPNKGFNGNYLTHYFRSGIFQKQKDKYCSGATQKAINNTAFGRLQVPKYSLEEQKQIARLLDQADVLCQKRKQSLQLLDDFLRATFLDMFGDPLENNKNFAMIAFGDVCAEIKYGTNAKGYSTETPGSIAVIRIPNVFNGEVNYEDLKFVNVDKAEKKRFLLQHDDLLFVRSNGNPEYIGRCAVFQGNKECINASYLIRARLKDDSPIMASFVRDVISFPSYRTKVLKEARTTAGNYNINIQRLRQLKILNPPRQQQQRYLKITKQANLLAQRLQKSKVELNNQFNALMQKYFS